MLNGIRRYFIKKTLIIILFFVSVLFFLLANSNVVEEKEEEVPFTEVEQALAQPNKGSLKFAIQTANKIPIEEYTEASSNNLSAVLNEAISVYENMTVTQSEVDCAKKKLYIAIKELKKNEDSEF